MNERQPGADSTLTAQACMVEALRVCLSHERHADAMLFETHISYVIVCADRAFKIKKALRTGYLDDSTVALRRQACEEELRLNRRLAPALYLGVQPITGRTESPVLGGAGPVLDWAVEMRSFTQDGLWDRLAARQALTAAHIDELVRLLVPFHAAAAAADPASRFGKPAQVRAPLLESLDELDRRVEDSASRAKLLVVREWERGAFERLASSMAERQAQGRVRECHGDLHLGNVTTIDGRVTVFDGIEFNDDFRWIDVMSELAFMAMDLHAHGLPRLAHRLVNAYLEASGDHGGVGLLAYYLVHRALVRAKVAWMRAGQGRSTGSTELPEGGDAAWQRAAAARYLDLAVRFCRAGHAALLITHGYSGSGKSTLTQSLLEEAGAVRLRADVERKRMAGLDALAHTGSPRDGGLYSTEATAATYARLGDLAGPMLAAGLPVILDATFLRRAQRHAARRVAELQGVPFAVLDVDVEEAVLRERLSRRAAHGGDASEADAQVLDGQIRSAEPLGPDEADAVFPVQPAHGAEMDWTPVQTWIASAATALDPAQGPLRRPGKNEE